VETQENSLKSQECRRESLVRDQYIPINKCNDGHLYIIKARNADIGIYNAEQQAFKISRYKGNDNFIDLEYHWDRDETGTAKPLKKFNFIGDKEDESLLPYLNEKIKLMYFEIMQLKKSITYPIVLITADRMKRLRMYRGGD
jgi:hypothetical protein